MIGDRFSLTRIQGLSELSRRLMAESFFRNAALHTAKWVKAIRKSVAKTSREFSHRFGIPVRTLEGWEQGRHQLDPAASVVLRVIERNPKAVEEG